MIGFAHRGAPAPLQGENTLPAFRRALAAGAGGLESDVWLTADGVPVLRHNAALGQPARRQRVTGLRRADLPRWLPALADLYRELGCGFELSLDLKGQPAGMTSVDSARAVIGAARAAGGAAAARRLWLCGPLSDLRAWREIDSEVRLVNSASAAEIAAHGGAASYARALRAAGVDALNLRAREWTPARAVIVNDLRAAGVAAFGWDAQSTATLRRLRGYGLAGLYSDHLHRLVRVTTTPHGPETPGRSRTPADDQYRA
ncbi:glycerophosphodiester phosphodiesterase [Frankia sp. EI5c]|uniref:glycerophosphodiester phosphodiesterase n=1 Tax=Frankia sp. EI5c TaxID=683316 RepID=UPI0008247994|nr:glycerophosphodiester phosphodiesterase [Frankia sp. EI5c]